FDHHVPTPARVPLDLDVPLPVVAGRPERPEREVADPIVLVLHAEGGLSDDRRPLSQLPAREGDERATVPREVAVAGVVVRVRAVDPLLEDERIGITPVAAVDLQEVAEGGE